MVTEKGSMPHFLITKVLPTFSKGDFVIARGMLDAITHYYPTAKISILCRNTRADEKFFSKYGDVYGELFVTYGRNLPRPLLAIEFIFKTLLYLIWIQFKHIPIDKHAKTIFSLYEKSDLIVYCGGGSPGGYGLANLIMHAVVPVYIAKKLDKKIYMSGLTIEPPKRFFSKMLTRFVLNWVDLITTRERLSIDVLKSLKIKTPAYVTSDYALLLVDKPSSLGYDLLSREAVPKNNKIRIGVNLMNWKPNFTYTLMYDTPYKRNILYRKSVLEALEKLLEKIDAIIVLFPLSLHPKSNDLELAKSIMNHFKKPLFDRIFILNENYSPEQLKAMIGTMDIFIGTRFHSVIFAISMLVPTISISFLQKTRGFMEMIGMKEWSLDFSTFTADKLVNAALKLLNERDKVISDIKNQLPKLQKDSIHNILLIDWLLDKKNRTKIYRL